MKADGDLRHNVFIMSTRDRHQPSLWMVIITMTTNIQYHDNNILISQLLVRALIHESYHRVETFLVRLKLWLESTFSNNHDVKTGTQTLEICFTLVTITTRYEVIQWSI